MLKFVCKCSASSINGFRSLPHVFSASSSYSSRSAKQHQQEHPSAFLPKFLVENLGFSEQESLFLSPKFAERWRADGGRNRVSALTFAAKANSVINFFKSHGFSDPQIRNVVSHDPRILTHKVDETLNPKVKVLQDLGISGSDLTCVISANPRLVILRLETVLQDLSVLLGTRYNLVSFLKKRRRLFWGNSLSPGDVVSNVRLLENDYGISIDIIREHIFRNEATFLKNPEFFRKTVIEVEHKWGISPTSGAFLYGVEIFITLSPQNIESKIRFFKRFEWNQSEIMTLIKNLPKVLAVSIARLTKHLEFLTNEMGYEPSFLACHPAMFTYSLETRLLPRQRILVVLRKKGLISRACAFHSVVSLTDLAFFHKFIEPYKADIPDLYQSYLSTGAPTSGAFLYGVETFVALSPERIESKIRLFKSFEWNQSQIMTLIKNHPKVLGASEAELTKRLEFLMNEMGYEPAFLACCATLFKYNLETRVLPRLRILVVLRKKGLISTAYALHKVLSLTDLTFFHKFVEPYKAYIPDLYQSYLSTGAPTSGAFLYGVETFFTLSPERIESKIRFFKSFEWNQSQIMTLIKNHPKVLGASEAELTKRLEFLMNEMGYEPAFLACCATLFKYNLETRVLPRLRILVVLRKKGLISTAYALHKVLSLTDLTFFHKFVEPYKADIPDLYQSYLSTGAPTSGAFLYGVETFVSLSPERIESKIRFFKSFEWNQSQIMTLIKNHPKVLGASEAELTKRLEFFMNEMGYEPAFLACCATLFQFSFETRVLPRLRVLVVLRKKGLIRKAYAPHKVLSLTDLTFFHKFVEPYKADIPEIKVILAQVGTSKNYQASGNELGTA